MSNIFKCVFVLWAASCSLLLNAQQKDTAKKIEIKNLGPLVNSAFADYAPVVSAQGYVMVFTSRRPTEEKDIQKGKEGFENIYASYYDSKHSKWLVTLMLGSNVNIPNANNSAIALSNDGQRMLVFRGGNLKTENGDIYESRLKGDEWTEPSRLPPPVNSDFHESSASIAPDGRTIYFVSDRPGGKGGRDIWYCTQDKNGQWGEAKNMGDSINTSKDEEGVFIHPDGKTLFFSSQGHNSMGGYDIFMVVFDETTNSWAIPENLGPPINTINDDVYFVMEANGITAYYASAMEGGYGDKDIYSIKLPDNFMKKNLAVVMGRVIDGKGNSVLATITVKNKQTGELIGTYSSNSSTGKYLVSLPAGKNYEISVNSDGYNTYTESMNIAYKSGYKEIIKDISLISKNAFLTGKTLDENGKPISVDIDVIDMATNQVVAKARSDKDGNYRIPVPPGKSYSISYNKAGYLFQSVNIDIPNTMGFEKTLKDLTLQKVDVGKKMVLNSIFFDVNKATLRTESLPELDRAAKLMKDMSTLEIEISGHTDNVGSKEHNQSLSEQRAKSVVDFLIRKGIASNRLKYVGFGFLHPVASNETEDGKQQNRRTEFKVLKVDMEAEQLAEANRVKNVVPSDVVQNQVTPPVDNPTPVDPSKPVRPFPLPTNFKGYDKDLDGLISYGEIVAAIDSFFEGDKNLKVGDITSLIDFYFSQE